MMSKTTNIIEAMPKDPPEEIITAIFEGRLCQYAIELYNQVEKLKHIITQSEGFAPGG